MTFREQVIEDLPTFLNVDEFGDTVDVDGVSMTCVLEEAEDQGTAEGVTTLEFTLYGKTSDFETLPVVGQALEVDERQAEVLRVDDQQGLLAMRMRWWNS